MKRESGITLMSLIIYIILLILVTSMLATMSTMFYKNTGKIEETAKYSGEFNKFNMYFIEDVKKYNNTYNVTSSEVIFKDGTTYAYRKNVGEESGAIYRDHVKICDKITNCVFTKKTDSSTGVYKEIINVQISVEGTDKFEVDNDYVLKYW